MENTLIDSMMFLNQSLEKDGVTLTDEQRKAVSNIMYYYAKECNNNILHSKLSSSDIEQLNREGKIVQDEEENIKAALHRIGLARDVITKLTQ